MSGPLDGEAFLEVQQIAEVRVFVTADGRCRLEGTEAEQSPPAEHSTNGGGETPTVVAICVSVQRGRRSATTWVVTAGGNAPRMRCRRELRSRRPAGPSA